MSKTVSAIVVIVVLALGGIWYATRDSVPSDQENENTIATSTVGSLPADGTYAFVPEESDIQWVGVKTLIAEYKDQGTIEISGGSFIVSSSTVTGGEVMINMDSIAGEVTSNTKMGIDKLTEHLKSADFFDVAAYPTAKFVVTDPAVINESGSATLNGNLTIKNKTVPVAIPVTFATSAEGKVVLNGEVTLNRTLWDIRYGSGKFFQDLGDNVIGDDITLSINAVARKAE